MRSVRIVLIALAVFVLAAAPLIGWSVNASRLATEAGSQMGEFAAPSSAARPAPYVSPGKSHKLIIDAGDQQKVEDALAAGAVEIADYGSYKLLRLDDNASFKA